MLSKRRLFSAYITHLLLPSTFPSTGFHQRWLHSFSTCFHVRDRWLSPSFNLVLPPSSRHDMRAGRFQNFVCRCVDRTALTPMLPPSIVMILDGSIVSRNVVQMFVMKTYACMLRVRFFKGSRRRTILPHSCVLVSWSRSFDLINSSHTAGLRWWSWILCLWTP